MSKRALLIGINYYGTPSELSGCHNDIIDMRQYLTKCDYTEFTILMDNADTTDAPTGANILSAMRRCIAMTLPGDTLYVHYSGHGSHIADQILAGRDERDGQDECICPVDMGPEKEDYGLIRDDKMYKLLVKGLAPGAHLRVTFDSCHSGSALDLPCHWITGGSFTAENTTKLTKDIIFLSGCKDNQYSSDANFNGRANGALTKAMLDCLQRYQAAGTNPTWKTMCEDIRVFLRAGEYDQVPQLSMCQKFQLEKEVDIL